MAEINCLVCEKPIKLPEYIDTEDYDGEVVCQECKSSLYIKLVKSKVRKYRVLDKKFKGIPAEEIRRIMEEARQEFRKEANKYSEQQTT